MPTARDGTVVEQLFEPRTFARGWSYAVAGAVVVVIHIADEDLLYGEVQGDASRPYELAVALLRSRSGVLVGVEGDCTCPVGYNCKHVVALVLESGVASGRTSTTDHAPCETGGWPGAVERLIAARSGEAARAPAHIALSFELAERPRTRGRAPEPGIRIRPVRRGARDNWIRTGISWSSIGYDALADVDEDKKRLLRELLAVSRLSAGLARYSYPSYGGEPEVWLEDIASRRIWDLLADVEAGGIPLVTSGRTAGKARVLRSPATLALDLVAAGDDLRMTPRVDALGDPVPVGSSLLIGRPPHGVAWMPPGPDRGPLELVMAPFDRPLTPAETELITTPSLTIGGGERTRFFNEFYPRLARSVPLVSSDRSIVLPQVPAALLVLRVDHDRDGCSVTWQRGVEGSRWRGALWTGPTMDNEIERAVEAVMERIHRVPGLIERRREGSRLAESAELSGMDGVRFVTEVIPDLASVPNLVVEQHGDVRRYREADGPPVVSLRPASTGFDGDWFDLLVEVTVDGEEVVFEQLFVALAEGQSHVVLPSGTYFALDRPELAELAELIAEAKAMADRDTLAPDRLRLSRYQAGMWEDLRRLGVSTAPAEEWDRAVCALAEAGDLEAVPPPEGIDATLRPYQAEGFAWLAFLYKHRLGGILADDMGLGKTLQALSLVSHARQDLGVDEPFLVVAPTSVVENWARECERFAPGLRVSTISETERRRWVSIADLAGKADLVITSYTLFRLEYDDYERVSWAGLFLDEAQFVKNHRSIANQRARTLPVAFKVAMTGTPIENRLKELWALLSITAPGLFPRWDRFAEQYAVPIEKHADADRLAQLQRRMRPLMLRRTKEQVASELPDKQEQVLELELAPKHRRIYQTHLQRERQKILGLLNDLDRNQFEILRSLTVLRQAALDIGLVDDQSGPVPSTKLDALMEMLDEVTAEGHRVLVFSQFTRFLSLAAQRAASAGIEYCYLDGRTRNRGKVIATFREGNAPVFFISLKAGGFGLNLTEADYCILLDPWWNPATEAQAVDRVHRIGQSRKVMVYRLVSKDTIEEKVMALKAKKAALFARIMGAGGFDNAALSAADIRALLE